MNAMMSKIKVMKKQKGSWFKITYVTDLPMTAQAKRGGMIAQKRVTATVRWGINYKNMASTKAKLEANPDMNINKLPWGEYVEGTQGLMITHKGQNYLRLYTSPNRSKVTYYLNGENISKADLIETNLVQAGHWNKASAPRDVLTLKCENIESIG